MSWRSVPLLLAFFSTAASAELAVDRYQPDPKHVSARLAPLPSKTSVLIIQFDTGSVDDEGPSGETRLTQHALLEANARLPYEKLLEQAFAADARIEMETSLQTCTFELVAPSEQFEPLAHTLLQMLLAPRLGSEGFRNAIRRTETDEKEENQGSNLMSAIATRLITDDLRYQNPPYGANDQLDDTELGHIRLHAQLYFAPANARVVVAGNFDVPKMKHFLDQFKGGTPRTIERPKLSLPLRLDVASPSEIQLIAMPVTVTDAQDVVVIELAASMIEESLESEFRGAGVGYSFVSESVFSPWLDALLVMLPAHDPSGIDLEPYLLRAIEKVRKGEFSKDAFAYHQQRVRSRFQQLADEPVRLAQSLLEDRGGPWTEATLNAALEKLSAERFSVLVDAWLRPDKGLYVKFHPKEDDPSADGARSPR